LVDESLERTLAQLRQTLAQLGQKLDSLNQAALAAQPAGPDQPYFTTGLMLLVLALFVGFFAVRQVTPALQMPMISAGGAIASVSGIGALMIVGPQPFGVSGSLGLTAIALASAAMVGGFILAQRLLPIRRKSK
jgi:NAD/NADP transhydrogenase alpha subunit